MNNRWLAPIAFLSGLLISGVAAWFSIIGLSKLFASAAMAVVIFGISIEVGKLVSASWLFHNWKIAPRLLKGYLLSAVGVLMFITSLGIWGYLNKSYADQTAPMAQTNIELATIKSEISIEQEKIDAARKTINQLSSIVDKNLGSKDENASLSALRQTNRQRNQADAEIKAAQKRLVELRQQQAKLETANQTIAHEVGPINYIAKTLYGDSDQNTVDKAVQLVIVLLVLVFDPLAIALLLAANFSMGKRPESHKVVFSPDVPTPVSSDELIQHLNTKSEEPEIVIEAVNEPITMADEVGSATQEFETDPPFKFAPPARETGIGQVIHHEDGTKSYKG